MDERPHRPWPAAPGTAVEGPLAHVPLARLADAVPEAATVRLAVLPVTGLLALRGDPERSALAEAVREATGLALPAALATSLSDGADSPPGAGRVLRWRSPDEWLLSCPIEELAELLEGIERRAGASACAVDVSGGYARFELSGEGADGALRRSTAYDPELDLPAGKVVSTAFAKTAVTMRRIDAGRVELVVRRSFADYVWTWLQRAAGPGRLAVEPFEERVAG